MVRPMRFVVEDVHEQRFVGSPNPSFRDLVQEVHTRVGVPVRVEANRVSADVRDEFRDAPWARTAQNFDGRRPQECELVESPVETGERTRVPGCSIPLLCGTPHQLAVRPPAGVRSKISSDRRSTSHDGMDTSRSESTGPTLLTPSHVRNSRHRQHRRVDQLLPEYSALYPAGTRPSLCGLCEHYPESAR